MNDGADTNDWANIESNDRSHAWHAVLLQWIGSIRQSKQLEWHFRCRSDAWSMRNTIHTKLQNTNNVRKVIKQDEQIWSKNAKNKVLLICSPFLKITSKCRKKEQSIHRRWNGMLRIFIFIYFEISTNHCSPCHEFMCNTFHTHYLSATNPQPIQLLGTAQRQGAEHKLKHQPIHYQGSSCDSHKVDVYIHFVYGNAVYANEFLPLQIQMTFICTKIIIISFFVRSFRWSPHFHFHFHLFRWFGYL